jgi:hypothetical protein
LRVDLLLAAHAAATWWMTGVIWFAQVVHYPLFAGVGGDRFAAYERDHIRRVVPLAAPLMIAELATGLIIAWRPPAGVAPWQVWLNTALLAVIWFSTTLVQLPAHARLRRGFDPPTHRLLMRTNWIRTIAWTIRSGLLLAWLGGAG